MSEDDRESCVSCVIVCVICELTCEAYESFYMSRESGRVRRQLEAVFQTHQKKIDTSLLCEVGKKEQVPAQTKHTPAKCQTGFLFMALNNKIAQARMKRDTIA